jgi:hypothetical protein
MHRSCTDFYALPLKRRCASSSKYSNWPNARRWYGGHALLHGRANLGFLCPQVSGALLQHPPVTPDSFREVVMNVQMIRQQQGIAHRDIGGSKTAGA